MFKTYGLALVGLLLAACNTKNADKILAENVQESYQKQIPSDSDEPFPYSDSEEVNVSKEQLLEFSNKISHWVSEGDPVGAEVLIIKNGKTIFHEVYGWSDRERGVSLKRNAIYRIRSMTKPFISTAALMLVDEGKISLENKVSDYLPAFNRPELKSITIQELLTHTSGLGRNGIRDTRMPKPINQYDSLQDLAEGIAANVSLGPNGYFLYKDTNPAIMGALVEKVSGMPLEDFIKIRILDPLGMNDTYTSFSPEVPWAQRMASTYRWTPISCSFERYWDNSNEPRYQYFRASGGIYSTPMDYSKLMAMWMNKGVYKDKRILSEESVTTGLYPHADRGDGRRYGMFWTIRNSRMTNGLPAVFGHGGSDCTIAVGLPEIDAIAIFFTQSRGSRSREKFLHNLAMVTPFDEVTSLWNSEVEDQWNELQLQSRDSDSSQASRVVVLSDQLKSYTGTYVNGNNEQKIYLERNTLFLSFMGNSGSMPLQHYKGNIFLGKDTCGSIFKVHFIQGVEGVHRYRILDLAGPATTFDKK